MKAPAKGYERQWYRCKTCKKVQYRDYIPYSLSNPILTTACGHGAAERDYGLEPITADEALIDLIKS